MDSRRESITQPFLSLTIERVLSKRCQNNSPYKSTKFVITQLISYKF